MQKFKIIGKPLQGKKEVEGNIEELMRENEKLMMHSEELMRILRNTDNSGHYVRPRTNNVCAHILCSHQRLISFSNVIISSRHLLYYSTKLN